MHKSYIGLNYSRYFCKIFYLFFLWLYQFPKTTFWAILAQKVLSFSEYERMLGITSDCFGLWPRERRMKLLDSNGRAEATKQICDAHNLVASFYSSRDNAICFLIFCLSFLYSNLSSSSQVFF